MNYKLETYEWDNCWIEKANDTSSKRVLYIGDSISCGTRSAANKMTAGEILFDGYGTSKALDNPYFFDSLMLFANQEKARDIIIFNNGLHGWHLSEDEYAALYESFITKLIRNFPNIPIMSVLTTFVTNANYHNDRVIVRNEIANKIAKEKNLNIIDLYSVSEQNQNLHISDGVHFGEEGYKVLAQEVLKAINI